VEEGIARYLDIMNTVIPALIIGGFLAVIQPAGTALSEPRQLELKYTISVSGVDAGQITLGVTSGDDGFRISSNLQSLGFIDTFIGFRSTAHTKGSISIGKIRPLRHEADNLWRGDSRHVRLTYGARGPLNSEVHPSAEDDDREAVPREMWQGTFDALSAAYVASLAVRANTDNAAARCLVNIPIFDGRRRYDIRLRPVGNRPVEGPVYRGSAFECDVELHRIAGSSKNPWIPRSENETGKVWYSKLSEDWPPVPVRFENDIILGSVVIDLQSATARDIDLKPVAVVATPPVTNSVTPQ
jgi:hypothetical protein